MGCSKRTKYADIRPEQKWEFISLDDFKSPSPFTTMAYGYLYVSLAISLAVYGVDTFTAVNLLAFDKWTSKINPYIPISISRWIFSGCIIASWVNLAFEWLRAIRVMRRGAVAESYLDSLAVRIQSIRPGSGWRRFLVFAELTKSKAGAEYVALFVYFSFQAWIRVIFCSGPRQVINALTLFSVYKADLDPNAKDIGTSFSGFFRNIKILAEGDYEQALVLSGMIFTFIIWFFAALSLLIAVFLYVFFLWHWIPSKDGGLPGYCERKINKRLTKIVSAKVNKAIEDAERKKRKAEEKAMKKGEKVNRPTATVPNLSDYGDDKSSGMQTLHRQDTMSTLPLYTSRPGTASSGMPALELSSLGQNRPYNGRSTTQASGVSNISYSSNAPLISAASDMGYARAGSPAPSLPALNTNNAYLQRTMTGNTNNSAWQQNNMMNPQYARGPYTQSPVPFAESPVQYGNMQRFQSPAPMNDYGRGSPAPQQSVDNYGRPLPRQVTGIQGERSAQGSILSRQATLPDIKAGQPTLPNIAAGQPTVPNIAAGQPTVPDIAAGQPTVPNIAAGQPTVPNIAAGQPTLPNIKNGRSSPPSLQQGQPSIASPTLGYPAPALRSPLHSDMRSGSASTQNGNVYVAYNPAMRSASAATNPMPQPQYLGNNAARPPPRNMTGPASQNSQQGGYFGGPRINMPQQGPARVGTPQAMSPRLGTPGSMRNMPNDYRQPRVNETPSSSQNYQAYQYPDKSTTSNRPRPPPPDDRHNY